jgi:hypothetical protein
MQQYGSSKIIPLADMVDQDQYSDGTLKAQVGYSQRPPAEPEA